MKVQEVENEIGEPLRSIVAYGIARRVEMRHAATVRNADPTIKYHRWQPGIDQRPEGLSEEPRAVIPIAAPQHKLAVTRNNRD
jgi:hypothetical protein